MRRRPDRRALALSRYARMQRSARTLEGALTQRVAAGAPVSTDSGPARGETPPTGLFAAIGRASIAWLDTSFGRIAVADEDRRLLDRCGYLDARARGAFMLARIAGAALAPVALMLLARGTPHGARFMLLLFVALSGGFMAPKWFVQSRANARQRAVGNELPMFVDLLRLLQGVGLSLDQSLQVMIHDFKRCCRSCRRNWRRRRRSLRRAARASSRSSAFPAATRTKTSRRSCGS